MEDYYSILGVSKTASAAEIKSAYRKKVVEWHPDRNKSKEAPDMIKKINKAYETLSDTSKKNIYDQVGHDSYEKRGGASASGYGGAQGAPGGGYSWSSGDGFNVDFSGAGVDMGDIFEQFFGFGGAGGQRRKRNPIYEVRITFDEAVKGVEKKTVIGGKEHKIKIPAGVDSGTRIRFEDFDVQVVVGAHGYFKRDGQDIYYERDISIPQAVLGGVVEVPTIDKPVKLKIQPGTPSGKTVRLGAQGVPYPNSTRRGDMYVVFRVRIPEKVSAKAKKLLEELDRELQ